jgi:hypothetical protein
MDINEATSLNIVINIATLISMLVIGFKVMRHMTRMEFKVDLMWSRFVSRLGHNVKLRDNEGDLFPIIKE